MNIGDQHRKILGLVFIASETARKSLITASVPAQLTSSVNQLVKQNVRRQKTSCTM